MIRVCAVLVVINAGTRAEHACELSRSEAPREGNLGESPLFPWLGVLRVHIHQGEVFKVALTGLLLVKVGYAIANADDVARIPKRIFKQDSKAMFIGTAGSPWFCNLLDYMTHPEYEYTTTNTIALVELDPGQEAYPMRPICWPPNMLNTSNALYAIGFTDDNQILEKSVFSIQYVERNMCEEFYNRVGLMENKLTPTHFICGFAKQNKENCVWDNGIVLASNSTKFWTLVGFGVRGPGCAAPARFIDLQTYLPWIESATSFDEIEDMQNYRKSAFNEGFKRRKGESTEEGELPDLTYMIQNYYPFNTEYIQNMYFTIDRIDDGAINIRNISLPAEEGNCTSSTNEILYKDITTVTTETGEGFVSYKLTMYDLFAMNYSCVKLWIRPATCNDTATLYYMTRIDNMEGLSFRDFGTTPEKLLQVYPIPTVTVKPEFIPTTHPKDWKPSPHLKVAFLEDDSPYINIENYNIYLKFAFENEALINLEVWGPLRPPFDVSTTTNRTLREGQWDESESESEYEDSTIGYTESTTATPKVPVMAVGTSEVPVMAVATSEMPMMAVATSEVPMMALATSEVPVMAVDTSEVPVMALANPEVSVMALATSEVPVMAVANSDVSVMALATSEVSVPMVVPIPTSPGLARSALISSAAKYDSSSLHITLVLLLLRI